MSFGYGIGDFLAVAKASYALWERFKKSPSDIRGAQAEYVPLDSSAPCGKDYTDSNSVSAVWQTYQASFREKSRIEWTISLNPPRKRVFRLYSRHAMVWWKRQTIHWTGLEI